jgi:hypothetical protein
MPPPSRERSLKTVSNRFITARSTQKNQEFRKQKAKKLGVNGAINARQIGAYSRRQKKTEHSTRSVFLLG